MKKNVSFNNKKDVIVYNEDNNIDKKKLWYSENELEKIKNNVIIEIKVIKNFSYNSKELYEKLLTYPKIKQLNFFFIHPEFFNNKSTSFCVSDDDVIYIFGNIA